MKIHEIEQGTPEWLELKAGKFSASTHKDLHAKETTAAYEKAIYKIVFERLTGKSPETFKNDYMERGNELEAEARKDYELTKFVKVREVGFVELNEWVGCSPDGLIGNDGLLEIKCPAYNTMINYLLKKQLPSIYKWQVHFQMYVTGRKWVDFYAYHPDLKSVIVRVERDEILIKEIDQKLKESIAKVKQILKQLKS